MQALCQVAGPCGGGVRQQNQELFASPAADRVGGSGHPQRAAVKILQHQVSCAVAVGVVDALEMVEVTQQQGQGRLSLLLLCHFAAPHVHQAAAVHGASEWVGGRFLGQCRLRLGHHVVVAAREDDEGQQQRDDVLVAQQVQHGVVQQVLRWVVVTPAVQAQVDGRQAQCDGVLGHPVFAG